VFARTRAEFFHSILRLPYFWRAMFFPIGRRPSVSFVRYLWFFISSVPSDDTSCTSMASKNALQTHKPRLKPPQLPPQFTCVCPPKNKQKVGTVLACNASKPQRMLRFMSTPRRTCIVMLVSLERRISTGDPACRSAALPLGAAALGALRKHVVVRQCEAKVEWV
jgi:hypothetical protein